MAARIVSLASESARLGPSCDNPSVTRGLPLASYSARPGPSGVTARMPRAAPLPSSTTNRCARITRASACACAVTGADALAVERPGLGDVDRDVARTTGQVAAERRPHVRGCRHVVGEDRLARQALERAADLHVHPRDPVRAEELRLGEESTGFVAELLG